MREWVRSLDAETRRVFVVVAVVWFFVSGALPVLGLSVFLEYQSLWDRLPDAMRDAWAASFLIAMLQLAPMVLVEGLGLAMVFSGLMYPPYSPSYTFLATYGAACALIWATIITTAFVFIRRQRQRRAASKGA